MHEAALHRLAEDIRADIAHLRLLLRRHVEWVGALKKARRALLEWRYDPNQPRIPAGSTGGGQWTSGDSGEARQPREMTRRWLPRGATPAQQTRFALAKAQADAATARVHRRDPTWRPPPSLTATAEGEIAHQEAVARAAEGRYRELQGMGIGSGPYTAGSIPARGPERDFTAAERREINSLGYEYGCHTCGTRDPGSARGNFVPDHQMPSRWNPHGETQRLFPQCLSCSARQGDMYRAFDGGIKDGAGCFYFSPKFDRIYYRWWERRNSSYG